MGSPVPLQAWIRFACTLPAQNCRMSTWRLNGHGLPNPAIDSRAVRPAAPGTHWRPDHAPESFSAGAWPTSRGPKGRTENRRDTSPALPVFPPCPNRTIFRKQSVVKCTRTAQTRQESAIATTRQVFSLRQFLVAHTTGLGAALCYETVIPEAQPRICPGHTGLMIYTTIVARLMRRLLKTRFQHPPSSASFFRRNRATPPVSATC